jgi:hypothetical protein
MTLPMTRTLILVVSLATLALAATPASAKSSKIKRLRSEIGRLEARLAEVEREMARQAQRLAQVPIAPAGFCSDPCTVDSDTDGLGDCEDPCPCDPNHDDTDADQWPDCMDPCPHDAENVCISACRAEPDGSGTGMTDCVEPCPPDSGPDCEPVPPPPPAPGACRRTGCSGQVCASEDVATTCEWLPEYACYAQATCEPQADGDCGWTITPEAAACLAHPPPL